MCTTRSATSCGASRLEHNVPSLDRGSMKNSSATMLREESRSVVQHALDCGTQMPLQSPISQVLAKIGDLCCTPFRFSSNARVLKRMSTTDGEYVAALVQREQNRCVAEVSLFSVLTTGIGTTVAAVKDPGTSEWNLNAATFMLVDTGVFCMDEVGVMKQHDRGAIHYVTERQSLSVARRDLVCTLHTRVTVVAAAIPKGGRISTEPGVAEAENADGDREKPPRTVGIAPPLLSCLDAASALLRQRNED